MESKATDSITARALCERYDGFLLDAYGVLVTSTGAIDGANDFLSALRDAGKPFVILTNDASKRLIAVVFPVFLPRLKNRY